MAEIRLSENTNGTSSFEIYDNDIIFGEMKFDVEGDIVNVYETKIEPDFQEFGFGKELLQILVSYSRKNQFKIVPTCPYVFACFQEQPLLYSDIWEKND